MRVTIRFRNGDIYGPTEWDVSSIDSANSVWTFWMETAAEVEIGTAKDSNDTN